MPFGELEMGKTKTQADIDAERQNLAALEKELKGYDQALSQQEVANL